MKSVVIARCACDSKHMCFSRCVSFINGSRLMALFPEAKRSGHPIAAPSERPSSTLFGPLRGGLWDDKSGDPFPAHPPAGKAAGEDDLLLGGALVEGEAKKGRRLVSAQAIQTDP